MTPTSGEELLMGWMELSFQWLVTSGLRVLVVLALALAGVRIYRSAVRRLEEVLARRARGYPEAESPQAVEKRIRTLGGIVRSAGVVAIWAVTIITVLKTVGIDIGPLLASAGIAGLAIGFGAQNLVRDVISGFFILLENQVRVGDVAVINGTGGLVEAVNLRTIVLRDQAGTVHIFPNGTITTLSNMTMGWSAMVFEIGVAYREDPDRVIEVMREVGDELRRDPAFADRLIEPLEIMGVDAFADSAVVIKARQKTKPIEQWGVGREYRRRLKKAFDERGIEIPFPHRTIFLTEASKSLAAVAGKKGDPSS